MVLGELLQGHTSSGTMRGEEPSQISGAAGIRVGPDRLSCVLSLLRFTRRSRTGPAGHQELRLRLPDGTFVRD